jgi:hypothetical protein
MTKYTSKMAFHYSMTPEREDNAVLTEIGEMHNQKYISVMTISDLTAKRGGGVMSADSYECSIFLTFITTVHNMCSSSQAKRFRKTKKR